MKLSELMLAQLEREVATSRLALQRVPEGHNDWKPHEKSMPMGRLAAHIAELPGWAAMTLTKDSFDINPPGGSNFTAAQMSSRKQLLELFEQSAATARAAISSASDEDLMKPWSLLNGGKTIFTLPKAAVLRTFAFSHVIHHRAQLGVYLRLNNIPIPQTYGPSADEGRM